MGEEEQTRQPARVIVGHCPDCAEVVILENNYEVWPLAVCKCGWLGDTFAIKNQVRMERGGVVTIGLGLVRVLRSRDAG